MANVTKLYVGNLSETVTSKHLKELFGNFGQVDEVAVLRGFGFVHFRRNSDATAALKALDDTEFMGSHIQVQVPSHAH
uniref:RRM domain-containing protein n=1 Tax=Amphimedon queenslandica TaxID=400682 RepID=A0A1X7TPS7_AMPQE